jgi:hypothetical protein
MFSCVPLMQGLPEYPQLVQDYVVVVLLSDSLKDFFSTPLADFIHSHFSFGGSGSGIQWVT